MCPPNRLGMLYQISTPVVGVFGTSSKQGKFTLQLALRKIMLEQGYSVGGIGTEPTSQLFGMDYVFPMGYNSTVYIDYNAVIHFLNSAMHNICIKNTDIIIVGSQSGTIPYAYGNISNYPTFQHAFLMGTLPDCIVLCVNTFDSFEYIHRTIAFLESVANSKVIALATIPFNTKAHNSFEKSKIVVSDDFYNLQRLFKSEFEMPLYNIVDKNEMIRLSEQIVDFFS